jgi:hypothetical protein
MNFAPITERLTLQDVQDYVLINRAAFFAANRWPTRSPRDLVFRMGNRISCRGAAVTDWRLPLPISMSFATTLVLAPHRNARARTV